MSDKVPGQGTLLYFGTAGGDATTHVATVRKITPPTTELPKIDKSHLESVAREFQAGLPDNGELEFEVLYDFSQGSTLLGMKGVTHSWKILAVDGSAIKCDGWISSFAWDGFMTDELISNPIKIVVDGPLELASGSEA